MTENELIQHRLNNLDITAPKFKKPKEIVSWLCGVQAQDYSQARWAIGMRIPGATNQDIEDAILSQKIIRTWLMRGTIHIVSPDDIQWISTLLAPRIIAGNKTRYREFGLDEKTLSRTIDILSEALALGHPVSRPGISDILGKAGIVASGVKLAHVLQYACLKNIICFGPKQGKDFTFMKLKLHQSPLRETLMGREKALSELAQRYFSSHGPASLKDFIWWSGLAPGEAKLAIEIIKSSLDEHSIDGITYFASKDLNELSKPLHKVHLLAGFDEYIVGYTNRSAGIDQKFMKQVIQSNGLFQPSVIMDGKVKGLWKPVSKKDSLTIEIQKFTTFSKSMLKDVNAAAERYADFIKHPSLHTFVS